jgi:hypothetical protein
MKALSLLVLRTELLRDHGRYSIFETRSRRSLTTARPPRGKIDVQIAKLLRARLERTTPSGGSFGLGAQLAASGST